MGESVRRIGLIGLGHWGPNIVKSFEATQRAKVVWLCDTNAENLARAAPSLPGARVSTNSDEVFADPDCDAVAISTPTTTHFEIATRALAAGKHVMVEKPITRRSDEAAALRRQAEDAGLILMVGHVFLFNAGIRKLREIIASGDLGDIYYMYAQRTNLGPVRTDVNALWDLASHDVSIFCYLMDSPPSSVSATGQSYLNENTEDVTFTTFGWKGGTTAHIHASWLNPRKVRQIIVVGSQKMAIWDDMDPRAPLQVMDKRVEYPAPGSFFEFRTVCVDGGLTTVQVSVPPPLQMECEHFLDCIERGERPLTDGRNGETVVRILEAASRSIANHGQSVSCDWGADG